MTERLFIYGTLLPGLCRHAAMQGAVACGPAWIEGLLVDLGEYPGLVPGPGRVFGELYTVDDALLARLDGVEEYDPARPAESLYLRQRVTVHPLPDGAPQPAWTYLYHRSVEGCPRLPHGDWRRWLGERGG